MSPQLLAACIVVWTIDKNYWKVYALFQTKYIYFKRIGVDARGLISRMAINDP